MPQDDEVKARMAKALRLAQECLSSESLLSGTYGTSRSSTPGSDARPIAILAAELYKHVEP
jgi:hypothetical protein